MDQLPKNRLKRNPAKQPGDPQTTAASMAQPQATLQAKLLFLLLSLAALVVIALAGSMFLKKANTESLVSDDQYQVVFIQDSVPYFGKLSNANDRYAKLEDVYYLTVANEQQVNPGPNGLDKIESEASIQLTKLGKEIHAPEDTMYISYDKIIFWENLKNDGIVTQAIRQNQQN